MAKGETVDQLIQTIRDLRKRDSRKLSDHQRDLVKWSKNVDRRYSWIILLALTLIIVATLGPLKIYGLIFAKVTSDGYYTREEASWPVSMRLTVKNLTGLASIVIHKCSPRKSMFIGGLLLVAGNALCFFSSSVVIDTLLLGLVQGLGYGIIFIPLMEVINSYFLKYRNVAFGITLCGGTFAAILLAPIFQWLLKEYPWRFSYLVLGVFGCIIPLSALILKPNPRPKSPKISNDTINENLDDGFDSQIVDIHQLETINSNDSKSQKTIKIIWSILKMPAFHMIWFNELIFFWVISIMSMVLVDYGLDHGCNQLEAEYLVQCLCMGEIIGQVILTYLIDTSGLKHKHVVVTTFLLLCIGLITITQVFGFVSMAVTTVAVSATYSLLYVLLNGLLVEHLGESQVTLGYGLASFICGILLILKPRAVGYFRDNLGSYDPLMFCLAGSCAIAAFLWVFESLIARVFTKKSTA